LWLCRLLIGFGLLYILSRWLLLLGLLLGLSSHLLILPAEQQQPAAVSALSSAERDPARDPVAAAFPQPPTQQQQPAPARAAQNFRPEDRKTLPGAAACSGFGILLGLRLSSSLLLWLLGLSGLLSGIPHGQTSKQTAASKANRQSSRKKQTDRSRYNLQSNQSNQSKQQEQSKRRKATKQPKQTTQSNQSKKQEQSNQQEQSNKANRLIEHEKQNTSNQRSIIIIVSYSRKQTSKQSK
jgi:DNA mismatch repair ATPase MutL